VSVPIGLGLGGLVLNDVIDYAAKRDLGRTTPAAIPAGDNYQVLADSAARRATTINPDASPLIIANNEYVPTPGQPVDTNAAASVQRAKAGGRDAFKININPNADASYYAHELGHAVSQKNKIGKFISDARIKLQSNPRLSKALMVALGGGVAGTAAALQEGDDDLLGSLALAAALESPALIDEALATKNGLAIMKDAGLRANLGQRGRLAGGYLSYLAPVIIAGAVGNAAGNMVDDHTALYDL